MQLTEQHESGWAQVEPVDKHDVPPPPAKQAPLSQSPLQQLRSWVQNSAAPTHCTGVPGLVWQYAPVPSSWQ